MGMGIGDWAQPPIPNPQSPYQKEDVKRYKFKNECSSLKEKN